MAVGINMCGFAIEASMEFRSHAVTREFSDRHVLKFDAVAQGCAVSLVRYPSLPRPSTASLTRLGPFQVVLSIEPINSNLNRV